jgi:hypothetical protein
MHMAHGTLETQEAQALKEELTATSAELAVSREKLSVAESSLEELRLVCDSLRKTERQTPQMAHFSQMESQIASLESRLSRRSGDMAALVEETKAAARMERARLVALHAAELREKDEQLVRFRGELETLVTALRSYSLARVASSESDKAMELLAAEGLFGAGLHAGASEPIPVGMDYGPSASLSLTQHLAVGRSP